MAFARHNIEKRRLIELVRLNPILWDCRLPHYKRSDKKKAIKWNELGRIFNVNGERVQRTFTSLREIFRRELNHEKLLGNRFQSKWEFYEAMTFLREVIRERKSRERSKANDTHQHHNSSTLNNNNISNNNNNNNNYNNINNGSGSGGLDEYQYFAPNDPNNPNNKPHQQKQVPTSATLYTEPQNQTQQQQQGLQLQSGVVLSLHANALNALRQYSTNNGQSSASQTTIPTTTTTTTAPSTTTTITTATTTTSTTTQITTAQQHQQQQQQKQPESPYSPHALSTLHSSSTSPSIYIKDEPDSQDETISLASFTPPRKQDHHPHHVQQAQAPPPSPKRTRSYAQRTLKDSLKGIGNVSGGGGGGVGVGSGGTLQVRRFSLTQPTTGGGGVSVGVMIGGSRHTRQPSTNANLIIDEDELDDFDGDLEIDEVDADIDEADVELLDDMPTHGIGIGGGGLNGDRLSVTSTLTLTKPHQLTAREVLYTKFGDFLAARLNTLHETVANELMNKILLLIAEK